MNTAKSLLDPIRVPRQIVVDHQIGVLKVDTFASRVCRDQEANRRIVSEFVLDLQPFLAGNGTMDTADAVRLPCQGADFLLQIKECVLMLCEDNELLIEKQILAFEQLRKTAPLAVFVREADVIGLCLEILQDFNFSAQLLNRSRGCRLACDVLVKLFLLFA